MDKNRQKWREMDIAVQKRTGTDRKGQIWDKQSETDRKQQKPTETYRNQQKLTETDRIGLKHTETDRIGEKGTEGTTKYRN